MRGGRTRVSRRVAENPRFPLADVFRGGTESYVSVAGVFYKVHTFTSSGSLVSDKRKKPITVEYLIVGGGGTGGNSTGSSACAGGGAGGYRSSVSGESNGGGQSLDAPFLLSPGSYTVTVGGAGTSSTIYRDWETDRKSTRLNSSHLKLSRMPSSA